MKVDRGAFASEMGISDEAVSELYRYFADEMREDAINLAEAAIRSDGRAFASIVHKLKGTTSSYRAYHTYTLIKEADDLCKKENWEQAFLFLPKITESIGQALLEIEEW